VVAEEWLVSTSGPVDEVVVVVGVAAVLLVWSIAAFLAIAEVSAGLGDTAIDGAALLAARSHLVICSCSEPKLSILATLVDRSCC
jgi:hypothetical protein